MGSSIILGSGKDFDFQQDLLLGKPYDTRFNIGFRPS